MSNKNPSLATSLLASSHWKNIRIDTLDVINFILDVKTVGRKKGQLIR